ncbi:unnamed protein product [Musa acuminata subsp. burmannicoides]
MCFCTTELIRPRSRVDGTQVGADVIKILPKSHSYICLPVIGYHDLRFLIGFRPFLGIIVRFLSLSSVCVDVSLNSDSRGNQREVDRQRSQTRKAQVKQRDDGLTPEQRRERDAKALQEKAAKKAAGAAEGGGGATDSKNKGNAKK